MDRKKFIITSALSAMSISTFGNVLRNSEDSFIGDCETTNDILGPFYRPEAPLTGDLRFEGQEGTQITIKGYIYDNDCVTLAEGAMVEIWHADYSGSYDNRSKKFRHRGRVIVGEDGNYEFKTIFPGKYLNGKLYRPAHVHFRVSREGNKELISQLYFQGDPEIPADPWASQSKAKTRILPITPSNVQGDLTVHFDIYLG